jgi:hypothetical protein
MLTVDEIKNLIASGKVTASTDDVIANGIINAFDGSKVDYTLHYGWDIVKSNDCDERWHKFNLRLMRWIDEQNYDPQTLAAVLAEIQVDDHHWEWFKKSLCYRTDEYHWFFLMANGVPQGACLLLHPKQSAFSARDVFYIEFIAVAPWNRENPMEPRTFKGLGTRMIKSIIAFGLGKLSFGHGFSLHALPRAADFYLKIGMHKVAQYDKGKLQYFEMPEDVAIKYAEAT